jgi:hypothetical protein
MPSKSAILTATAFSVALAAPALGESVGEMSLTIAGEEHVVPLWGSQSDWSGGESWPSINIYARAFNEDGEDPLVVSLGFEAPRWTVGGTEMRLTRYENGEVAQRLYSGEDADEGGLLVSIDAHEVNGTELTLTGRFEGTMGTSENSGRDIDLSDGVPVAGTFEVTLAELD